MAINCTLKENYFCGTINYERMRKHLLLLFILTIFTSAISAQILQGVVKNQKGEPIEFANVAVLAADSSLVSGGITDQKGHFKIENTQGACIVRTSSLGYKQHFSNFSGQTFLNIVLTEDAQMMSEVVVSAKLPKTILKGEGMITNVSGTILEKSADVRKMLNLVPMISVTNGNIEVLGRGTPLIYINGRKMTDAMELDRLQPENIKTVEVINNPGARYSASTRCVVRITTKQRKGEGFGFINSATAKVNDHSRMSWYDNLNWTYSATRWQVSGTLYGKYSHENDNKKIRQITQTADKWEQATNIEQEYTQINPYASLLGAYFLNDSNSIGARISYDRYARWEGAGNSELTTFKNSMLDDFMKSNYLSNGPKESVSSNIYYVGKIKKLGIDFNTDYFWQSVSDRFRTQEWFKDAIGIEHNKETNTLRQTYNSLIASKLVFTYPILGGELSVGGEASHSLRKNYYQVEPIGVVDEVNSRFTENMTSGMVDYSRTIGRVWLQAGIRYENVNFKYFDRGVYMPDLSRKFNNVFPSLAISFPVGKVQMQLTYASDISRPGYGQLRSGLQYDNRFMYETGNPFLMPTINRNLTYNLSWKWFSFMGMFRRNYDEISYLMTPYKDDARTVLMRPENISDYNSMTFTLSFRPRFGIYQPILDMSLYKQWYEMETLGNQRLTNPVASFNFRNVFDTKWFVGNLSFQAQTGGNMGNGDIGKGYYRVDLGIDKTLLQKRLTLSLYVFDLFHTGKKYSTIYSGAMSTSYFEFPAVTTFSLSAKYKFNATRSKYKGTGAGASQRDRM